MATIRIEARRLRVGHVLAVTGETVARRFAGDKPVAVELLGTDGVKRPMTYAGDVMVTVRIAETAEV